MKRVLLLGGTGVFGKRLARHLLECDGLELFVSSRKQPKADQVADALRAHDRSATVHGIAVDTGHVFDHALQKVKPDIVVDCTGPFQYAQYGTASKILSIGAHLVDLADASAYLSGFHAELDGIARSKGVVACTGASSTPALSTCVVKHVTENWQRVDTIDIAIAPGGRSDVGHSVIAAILSYAGKEIDTWSGGKLARTIGWRGGRRISIPGLGTRRVASVETYDAKFLGPRFSVTSRVSFAAGLESRTEQFGIEIMAALRRAGVDTVSCPVDPIFVEMSPRDPLAHIRQGRHVGIHQRHRRARSLLQI